MNDLVMEWFIARFEWSATLEHIRIWRKCNEIQNTMSHDEDANLVDRFVFYTKLRDKLNVDNNVLVT